MKKIIVYWEHAEDGQATDYEEVQNYAAKGSFFYMVQGNDGVVTGERYIPAHRISSIEVLDK